MTSLIPVDVTDRLLSGLAEQTPEWLPDARESPLGLAQAIGALQPKPFHYRIMEAVLTHPKVVILVFRGAGKTIDGSGYLPAWLLGHNRDFRICLASHSLELAKLNMEFVSNIMQHARYEFAFGKTVPPRNSLTWNDTAKFVLGRDPVRHKDPSLYALGYDGSALGHRVDWFIGDDLLELKNSRTPVLRARFAQWFFQEVMPLVEPSDQGGHAVLFGTSIAPDDIYAELESLGWYVLKIPVYDDTGHSIWPERYSDDYLATLEKERGRYFATQYLLKPATTSTLEFDPASIGCRQVALNQPENPADNEPVPIIIETTSIGVDPATSLAAKADRFAAVVIGSIPCEHSNNHPNDLVLLDCTVGHFSMEQQEELLVKCAAEWRASIINVEKVAAQAYLIQRLSSKLSGVQGSPTTLDTGTRFETLDDLLRSGRVFWRADEEGDVHPSLQPLYDELDNFPARYDDLISALDKAIEPLAYNGPPAAMASAAPLVSAPVDHIQQHLIMKKRWFRRRY